MRETPIDLDPQSLLSHGDFVRAIARRMLDAHAAEDVAQETWTAAVEHPPAVQSMRAWVAVVAKRFAWRRKARTEGAAAREREAPPREPIPSAADVAEREEARRAVVDALLQLAEPYRTALLLHFYEDLPVREVARRTGVPAETARTRIRRGIEQLRSSLQSKGRGREAWMLAAGGALIVKGWIQAAAAAALILLAVATTAWVMQRAPGAGGPRLDERASPAVASVPREKSPESAPAAAVAAGTETRRAPAGGAGPAVHGRVVDSRGKPVRGARVTAAPLPLVEFIRPGATNARATRTADDGSFQLELLQNEFGLALCVDADGFEPGGVERATPDTAVECRLRRGATLRARVVDEEGVAVAGAEVVCCGILETAAIEHRAVTAPDGRFVFESLPTTFAWIQNGSLQVKADGYAFYSARMSTKFALGLLPSREVVFVIDRGFSLRVHTVDDESGQPIAGARVVAWCTRDLMAFTRPGGVISSPLGITKIGERTAGPDGCVVFDAIPGKAADAYVLPTDKRAADLAVFADGYVTAGQWVAAKSRGSAAETEVRLRRGGTVRGRIVDESGEPVAGLSVYASAEKDRPRNLPRQLFPDWNFATQSQIDGSYRLNEVEAPTGHEASAKIYANLISTRRPYAYGPNPPSVEVPLRAGHESVAPDLVVPSWARPNSTKLAADSAAVTVHVRDEARRPVAGVDLWLKDPGEPVRDDVAYTGADGTARIVTPTLSPSARSGGNARTVVAEAPGFAHAESETFFVIAEKEVSVELILKSEHTIRGFVFRGDGTPAADATVSCSDAKPTAGAPPEKQQVTWRVSAPCGDDGSFVLHGLPDGMHRLSAERSRRGASGRAEAVRCVSDPIAAGSTDALLRFDHDGDPPAGDLDLTVTDAATGKPITTIAAVLVRGLRTLYGANGVPGSAAFADVAPGEYELRIMSTGYATARVAGVVIADGVRASRTVALSHGASVRGNVRGPNGVDPARFSIILDPADRSSYRGEAVLRGSVGADGGYRIDGVAPGVWRVYVFAKSADDDTPSRSASFVPSDPAALLTMDAKATEVVRDVEAVAAGALTLRIESPRVKLGIFGAPPTDAQLETAAAGTLTIFGEGDRVLYQWKGLDDRIVQDRPLPAGPVRVRLELPGVEPVEQRAVITAGKWTRLTLAVP